MHPPLGEAGRLAEPLMAVVLDDDVPPATLERAVARAGAGDRLLVGIASGPVPARIAGLLDALDLTLTVTGEDRRCVTVADPEEELEVLRRAAARNPQAAVVLGQVLRASESLPVGAALDVESFAYSTLLDGPEFRRWVEGRGPRPLPPVAEEPVLVRRDADRLVITLNRPERRNAYGRQARDALVDALELALLDPTLDRVVLEGAGPSFCSGGDLDEFGTTPDLVTAHFVRTRGGAGRLVHRLGTRIEARVHGACVGAGIELPALAGTVVAAARTTFRLPEVAMGLIPGAGGTVGIPRRIGRWRTLYLALTGRPLDAATALAWGLVDEVLPDDSAR
ncbi:enoyl-CoA hydratase/isomerase family protein [Thermomonospora echinospora]|uniref:enoyl-CoA hydratase/isomerase family protein n=1 Tax=Thermomonospora echinospora TaxID=1992 RepID=UPI00190EDB57|nr:enoyl-CoA hydratase/isomerase family protein [Thermomonospora echinospora]